MTPAELHTYCAAVKLGAPVDLSDAKHVLEDIRPRVAAGIPFEVTLDKASGGLAVTLGSMRSRHRAIIRPR